MTRQFTTTECTVILALHRTMPFKGCHSGAGWSHSDKTCFITCYDTWQRSVEDVALVMSFVRPALDRQAFVAACRVLTPEVSRTVDRIWSKRGVK